MKSGGALRTIDPRLRESVDDRRPGSPEIVDPYPILLLRGVANVDASAPVTVEIEGLNDNFDAARGICLAAALGTSLWIVIGSAVWSFVR